MSLIRVVARWQEYQVTLLSALKDNYIFAIEHQPSKSAWVVDPGEAAPVQAWLTQSGLKLRGILLTHHHADHVGGAQELLRHSPDFVAASNYDLPRIPGATQGLADGQVLALGPQLKIQTMSIPGHTLGHMAFVAAEPRWLFVGDTLFSLGCGRLFEGTFSQMFLSLSKLKSQPPDSLVFCGHEYTVANAHFALSQPYPSEELQRRFHRIQEQRQRGEPTVPFVLSEDLATNPFLLAKSVEEFRQLRLARNDFQIV